MEYYSAIKKNEAMAHATTWVSLEDMVLGERNQTKRHPNYIKGGENYNVL